MSYEDLREFIDQADKIGKLKRLNGVNWELEVGAIGEMSQDAVLFDNFPGYPKGYRVLVNMTKSVDLFLLAMNLKTEARENALAKVWRDCYRDFKPIPPKWVDAGPIQENIQRDDDVDVLKFPVPKLHPHDGGRYIGTADSLIMRDPESGQVNMGTFRTQVIDKATLVINICHGK